MEKASRWKVDCYCGAHMSDRSKILIVEDDNPMAQMCAKLIRRQGHTVLIANSGSDALAIVKAGGDVDLVLSDLRMPRMNGLELAGHLAVIDSKLPVIVMTGFLADLPHESSRGSAVVGFIAKPFEPDTLISRIEKALRARQAASSSV